MIEISDEQLDALSAILAHALGIPLTPRWVLSIECIDTDGEQTMTTTHAPNMAAWDAYGMARYGAAYLAPEPGWAMVED